MVDRRERNKLLDVRSFLRSCQFPAAKQRLAFPAVVNVARLMLSKENRRIPAMVCHMQMIYIIKCSHIEC